jgi:hypothetical protein
MSAKLTIGTKDLAYLGVFDNLPRRGVAIRPDFDGRWVVFEDREPLGPLLKVWDVVDYVAPSGPLAYLEVEYQPTAAVAPARDHMKGAQA